MKKAGDILNKFFDEVQKKQGEDYNNFKNSWLEITGDKIGYSSNIQDIIDGTLLIEIDHPGLKQLILLKKNGIISEINRRFPELNVKTIKFIFKNQSSNNVFNSDIDDKIEIKTEERSKIDENFLDLLQKMSKRSEES